MRSGLANLVAFSVTNEAFQRTFRIKQRGGRNSEECAHAVDENRMTQKLEKRALWYLKVFPLCLGLGSLAACAPAPPENVQRAAVVEGYVVFWRNYSEVSDVDLSALSLQKGEGLYFVGAGKDVEIEMQGTKAISSEADCRNYASEQTTTYETLTFYSQQYGFTYKKTPRWDTERAAEISKQCIERLRATKKKVPDRTFAQRQKLAERAVAKEGSCSWGGYDDAFDRRARRVTKAIYSDETRFFFAKMRCVE